MGARTRVAFTSIALGLKYRRQTITILKIKNRGIQKGIQQEGRSPSNLLAFSQTIRLTTALQPLVRCFLFRPLQSGSTRLLRVVPKQLCQNNAHHPRVQAICSFFFGIIHLAVKLAAEPPESGWRN